MQVIYNRFNSNDGLSAYHEAGHAFMAIYVAARVRSLTIDPDHDDGPDRYADTQVEWPIDQFSQRELQEKVDTIVASSPNDHGSLQLCLIGSFTYEQGYFAREMIPRDV